MVKQASSTGRTWKAKDSIYDHGYEKRPRRSLSVHRRLLRYQPLLLFRAILSVDLSSPSRSRLTAGRSCLLLTCLGKLRGLNRFTLLYQTTSVLCRRVENRPCRFEAIIRKTIGRRTFYSDGSFQSEPTHARKQTFMHVRRTCTSSDIPAWQRRSDQHNKGRSLPAELEVSCYSSLPLFLLSPAIAHHGHRGQSREGSRAPTTT